MEPVTAMVGGMFGAWMGEWATVAVANALLNGVSTKLNASDLDRALKEATKAAEAQENESFLQGKGLFFRCEPNAVRKFLEQFFKGSGLEELQKPLKEEGTPPQVDFLVAAFRAAAQEHPKIKGKIDESLIKPWMEVFVRTYFKQTNTYLKFQVAKEDYFKQLANYFDDVKFAGIAVQDNEIEKSEKLAQIFVMPDVVEDVQNAVVNVSDWLQHEIDALRQVEGIQVLVSKRTGNRQAELLQEQRQRSQLENRSGRKFLAAQLLSQSQSQKVVLLGAPGSGKTTLLSYFAVMLAQRQTSPAPLTPQLWGEPESQSPPELGSQCGLGVSPSRAPGVDLGGEKNVLGLAADTDWLPILIRIRDLARCSDDIGILDYARQFAEKTLAVKALPVGFFEYWLEDGRALILLDGLVRDLLRPASKKVVDELVERVAGDCNDHQQQLFRDSLHAAFTLDEVNELMQKASLEGVNIYQSSDRHWTAERAI